jgi:DNA-binding response OmpR family regulator
MDLNNDTAHVLVVDDEGAIRYSVSKTLQRIGYEVDEAASGEDALSMVKKREYDVVLTDIKMPGITGVDLLRKIKEASPDAIVILMTGFASLGTAVESLRLGAHDYLIKPSSSQDIRASVSRGVERSRNLRRRRALLDAIRGNVFELTRADVDAVSAVFDRVEMPPPMEARTEAVPATSVMMETLTSNMTLGPLTIYPGRYQISVGDKPIDLTPTEFDLLLYLAAHRGRVVSCHELVREVRGYAVDETEAREVIRPHVSNLRRKLKQTGDDADIIVNVRGIGYRLSETGQ